MLKGKRRGARRVHGRAPALRADGGTSSRFTPFGSSWGFKESPSWSKAKWGRSVKEPGERSQSRRRLLPRTSAAWRCPVSPGRSQRARVIITPGVAKTKAGTGSLHADLLPPPHLPPRLAIAQRRGGLGAKERDTLRKVGPRSPEVGPEGPYFPRKSPKGTGKSPSSFANCRTLAGCAPIPTEDRGLASLA